MNGSSQPPGEGQKPPLADEVSSNSSSLVARKRKKDIKPIITKDDAAHQDDEPKPGCVFSFSFVHGCLGLRHDLVSGGSHFCDAMPMPAPSFRPIWRRSKRLRQRCP